MELDVGTAVVFGTVAGGVVSASCATLAWANRDTPGAVPFAWLLVAAAGWAFLSAVTVTTGTARAMLLVDTLVRLTTASIVGLWLVFTLTYTGQGDQLTGPRIAGLFAVTGGYGLLSVAGLVEPTVRSVSTAGLTLLVVDHGPVYLLQSAVSFLVVAAGYAVLVESLLNSRNVYRTQTTVLVVGSVFPPAAHLIFLVGVSPHPGLNLAPITFALTALVVSVALFQYDSRTVTPLAENILVEELPDPVFVLDDGGQIVDHNTAAAGVFDVDNPIGGTLEDLDPGLPSDVERGGVFSPDGGASFYEPHVSSITDDSGEHHGRLLMLRNITGQQHRQDRLEALQTATQRFIEAKQPEQVAELAVQYVTDILDQNAAGVFLTEGDRLEPVALSDAAQQAVDETLLEAGLESPTAESLWRTYRDGTTQVATLGPDAGPLETALLLPLGDHGAMAIGSTDDSYPSTDRQYASILARTTQVALDQVERERELRRNREVSRRRREQIDFFNGVLRHSLRNAMLVIQGRAEHVRGQLPADQHDHIRSITDWCERLTDISGTIRGINDTIAASEDGAFVEVDLSTTVREAVRSVAADSPSAEFDVDVDDSVRIEGTEMAQQVLVSVLRNAVEHNDRDVPHVEVTLRRASDWVQVRIADDGPGISHELKTTMFQRSIAPSDTGDGFGLYFVSVMMELYGGTVWFEDNDPRGTVAILEFRLAAGDIDGGADRETQAKSHED